MSKRKIQVSRNAYQTANDGLFHPETDGGGGSDYELPPASRSRLGGIRVGDRLSVTPLGTLSADDQHYDDTAVRALIAEKQAKLISGTNIRTVNGHTLLGEGDIVIQGGGDQYILPAATKLALGGVRVGDRLTVTGDGTLAADDQHYDDTVVRDQIAGNARAIVDANTRIDGKQDTLVSGTTIRTVNGQSVLGSGDIEIGGGGGGDYVLPPATSERLGGVKTGQRVTIATDGTLSADDQRYDDTDIRTELAGKQATLVSGTTIKTVNGESILGSGNIVTPGNYTLPPATATALGGVKVGARLSVAADGTLAADDQKYDDTAVRTLIAGKQDTLVSGANIRTVNGQPVLGSGNLVVAGTIPDVTFPLRTKANNADPDGSAPLNLLVDPKTLTSNFLLGLQVKVNAAKGISVSNGIGIRTTEEAENVPSGIEFGQYGGAKVKTGAGLALTTDGVTVKTSGIVRIVDGSITAPATYAGSGIAVSVDTNGDQTFSLYTSGDFGIQLDTIQNELQLKIVGGTLKVDSSGLRVNFTSSSGLTADANGLGLNLRPAGGLSKDYRGLKVNGIDFNTSASNPSLGTPFPNAIAELITIENDSNGILVNLGGQDSGLSATKTIVAYMNHVGGKVMVTYTGTGAKGVAGNYRADLHKFFPGRSDIQFTGFARVTFDSGNPFLVPYSDGNQTTEMIGDTAVSSWAESAPAGNRPTSKPYIPGAPDWNRISAQSSWAYNDSHEWATNYAGTGVRSFGALQNRLVVPVGCKKVTVEHFFFSLPNL